MSTNEWLYLVPEENFTALRILNLIFKNIPWVHDELESSIKNTIKKKLMWLELLCTNFLDLMQFKLLLPFQKHVCNPSQGIFS